jgi:hypothetical protein
MGHASTMRTGKRYETVTENYSSYPADRWQARTLRSAGNLMGIVAGEILTSAEPTG